MVLKFLELLAHVTLRKYSDKVQLDTRIIVKKEVISGIILTRD